MKAEIRQAFEVRHINLNPYIGFCAEFPDIYIVSEHCAKGSLQDILLRDDFKLDWTFRMSFALDIARGMEELHKTSIGCHSNLKSTNVLVDSYWICKVADYGLQTFRENRLHSEETLLTQTALFWTAPECLRTNTGNTPLGDVYSYGIILQEIALREKPFSTSLLGPKGDNSS
ncbi:atrial natriuretic peptide receptor 2-like [Stylophora pistillata]|uniref:atrial natriuretic peptide receptor 2-like n=1 Tax=Stylophora pistillata TaxID=50429 RepID=UPI000C04FBF8|nr:atrial natriuretic peptide receptor 2-like [Stylophora pistillata]